MEHNANLRNISPFSLSLSTYSSASFTPFYGRGLCNTDTVAAVMRRQEECIITAGEQHGAKGAGGPRATAQGLVDPTSPQRGGAPFTSRCMRGNSSPGQASPPSGPRAEIAGGAAFSAVPEGTTKASPPVEGSASPKAKTPLKAMSTQLVDTYRTVDPSRQEASTLRRVLTQPSIPVSNG